MRKLGGKRGVERGGGGGLGKERESRGGERGRQASEGWGRRGEGGERASEVSSQGGLCVVIILSLSHHNQKVNPIIVYYLVLFCRLATYRKVAIASSRQS